MPSRVGRAYAPAERQKTSDGWRYVRLSSGPIPIEECLPWLICWGYVIDRGEDEEGGRVLDGWGTTYFMVPWERSVKR